MSAARAPVWPRTGRLRAIALRAAAALVCAAAVLGGWPASPARASQPCPELLDHRLPTLQGGTLDLCRHAGKPILVVNTASKCGYTPQFESLEMLNRRYGPRGLLVVGFPSNDFGQELASDGEIARFCKMTYAVEFPLVAQGAVTGPGAHPFFRELTRLTGQAPRWNFHKYLIAPDGRTVHAYPSRVRPDSDEIVGRLRSMLRR